MTNSDRSDPRRPVSAPKTRLQVAEGRSVLELGAFVAVAPMLRFLRRGDHHPVLVLPGFTAADRSTAPLRFALRSQGYWTHGWGLGANVGPTDRIVAGMHARLEQLVARHGRAISLVGWSLGGIFARELARVHPESVRQVITLGSPFRMMPGDRSTAQATYDRLSPRFSSTWTNLAVAEHERPALTVPSTAVYSRTDGVCRWHMCINERGDRQENVEVRSSHFGLGVNPTVIYVISDRLSQPEGEWKPFRAPPSLRRFYPPPASYEPAA